MAMDYFTASSIVALFFTGLLLIFIFIVMFKHYNSFVHLNYYQKLMFLCTLVIAIGTHGLMQMGFKQF